MLALLDQLLAGGRDQEGRGHGCAAGGREIRHHVAVGGIALHVVLLRDRANRLPEDGLGGDIAYQPPAEIDARRALLQGFDIVPTATSGHTRRVLSGVSRRAAYSFRNRVPRQRAAPNCHHLDLDDTASTSAALSG